MTTLYLIDATTVERKMIESNICPYCRQVVEFEWSNSKHTPNDKIGECPKCKGTFMECYDVTHYLLEKIA